MKNKEWLKETLKKRMDYWELNVAGGDYGRGRSDETRELLKAIDQLEEPEQEKVVVEKEKLYQVLDKEGYVMMRKYKGGVVRVNATMKPSEYPYWQKEKLGLTEQEIKDYDERFWAFAEEITK